MEPIYRPLSDNQRKLAYGRLPSRPILLATTSSPPPTGPRYMETVGQHPIVGLWPSDQTLPVRIIRHLRGIEWLAIDVVRLGCSTDEDPNPTANKLPVLLLITISPDSTTDAKALFDTAWRCKSTLNLYEIDDVEVEMKASEAVRATSEETIHTTNNQSSRTPHLYSGSLDVFDGIPLDGKARSDRGVRDLIHLRHLCDSIGTRFSHSDEKCTGTKGLLLDVLSPKHLAGPAVLTCRHVVFHGSSDAGRLGEARPRPSGQGAEG